MVCSMAGSAGSAAAALLAMTQGPVDNARSLAKMSCAVLNKVASTGNVTDDAATVMSSTGDVKDEVSG